MKDAKSEDILTKVKKDILYKICPNLLRNYKKIPISVGKKYTRKVQVEKVFLGR